MSDILPKTPDPEIDKEKFIDWKAVAINQEKIRISVEKQKRRFKIFNIVCICISIVLLILVVILLRYCRQNINEQKEYILSEHDKLMENGVTIDSGVITNLANIATSGSYDDLLDVPTKLSDFTNDGIFITKNADDLTNYYKKITLIDNRYINSENYLKQIKNKIVFTN